MTDRERAKKKHTQEIRKHTEYTKQSRRNSRNDNDHSIYDSD